MTKPKRTLAELDILIRRCKKFLKQIEKERRELIKEEARKLRVPKKIGRKPTDPDILELAKLLGQRKTLTDVALQLNLSLKTLYNHGISRAALDKEKLLNQH